MNSGSLMKWGIIAGLFFCSAAAGAAEKKPPVAQYWMDAATQNMIIPGISSADMAGMDDRMTGRMQGMGPKNSLELRLLGPKTVSQPEASHDIPPGQKMGPALPLLTPEAVRNTVREGGEERQYEKPKMRMLFYWGCGEKVRASQPKILDTEKMSLADFGKAMGGRHGSSQTPPAPRTGWTYGEWPNRQNSREVPRGSSLEGEHVLHGNYSPEMKFRIDGRHDFMPPVEFSALRGGLSESIRFQWKSIPGALGYFAMAMANNERTGEMIIWSSSEVQEPGYGLLSYLVPADVTKFVHDKVVMSPETGSCAIPEAIFRESRGAVMQFIAYGDELNIAWPPKSKDSKKPHDYIWSMKLRNKSTAMAPLGQEEGREERRTRNRRAVEQEERSEERASDQDAREEQPQRGRGNLLRGLFGF